MGRHRGRRSAGGFLLLLVLLAAGTGPAVPARAGQEVDRAGSWSWPLSAAPGQVGPTVVRRFAVLPSPWLPGHRGVDLATTAGQAVLAPAGGRVVFSGTVVDRGVLTIEHASGLRTSYEPVVHRLATGTSVQRGDVVAVVGGGRDHCPVGTCLHWGLRRGRTYLDPLTMVRGRPPIVLLPFRAPAAQPGSLRSRRRGPQAPAEREPARRPRDR